VLTPLLSRDLLRCVQFLFYFLLARRNGFRLQLLNILNLFFNHRRDFLPSILVVNIKKYIYIYISYDHGIMNEEALAFIQIS
jgi:hypothetical protein